MWWSADRLGASHRVEWSEIAGETGENRVVTRRHEMARGLLSPGAMTFSHVVDRVRAHFTEMPGLELTMPQAVRLLGFGVDDCRFVIDSLVDAGFLRWTARRTIVRTDGVWSREAESSYVSVRRRVERNTTVDSD
jgi:hypothetical protein